MKGIVLVYILSAVLVVATAASPDTRHMLFAAAPEDATAMEPSAANAVCYAHQELMDAIDDVETAASLAPLSQFKLSDLLKQSPEQINAVQRVAIVLPSDWECQAAASGGVHPCPSGVPSLCRYYNFDLREYHQTNRSSKQVSDWAALTAGLAEPDISQLVDDVCAQHYCATVQPDHFCCDFLPSDQSLSRVLSSNTSLGDELCGVPRQEKWGLVDFFAQEQWGYADWQSDPHVANHYVSFDVSRLEMGHSFGLQLYSPSGLDVIQISTGGSIEFNPLGSKVNIPIDETMQYSFAGPTRSERRMRERLPSRASDRKGIQETRFEGSCHPVSGCRRVVKAQPPPASDDATRATTRRRLLVASSEGLMHMPTSLIASTVGATSRLVSPGRMRLIGRWAEQSGGLAGDWPGIGFELRLNAGPDSTLLLNAWSISSSSYDQALRCTYDGNPSAWSSQQNIVLNLQSAQTEYPITPPEELGAHVLKCIKFTEKDDDGKGIFFKGVIVSADVTVLEVPSPSSRRMVFYGDSDTACGFCCNGPKYGGDDVTSGWAYQLAARFQADAQFIAKGGQYVGECGAPPAPPGASYDYDGASYDDGMCTLIHRALPWDAQSHYQAGGFKAEVVTVFLGANDDWPGSVSKHHTRSKFGRHFQAKFLVLLNKVWAYHAGEGGARPTIVGLCGGSGSPKHDKSLYCQNVKAAITQFNAEAHTPATRSDQAHYVEIDKSWWTQSMATDSVYQGCDDHWSDYGGSGIVESVLSAYERITGWTPTRSDPLPSAVAQTSGNSCPAGSSKPLSVGQCKLAADALGLTFQEQEKDRNWPAGCYQCFSGTSSCTAGVWWNKHRRGKATPGAGPVCVTPRTEPMNPAEPTQPLQLLHRLQTSKDSCDAPGLSHVPTVTDCIAAAKALQLVFAESYVENDVSWPKGCYLWSGDATVIWNSHPTGSKNDGGRPICVGAEMVHSLAGQSSCTPAQHFVDDVTTSDNCKKVSAALKLDFDGTESEKSWPRGCYFCHSCGASYFNTHATGGANSDATPICNSKLS